MLKPYEHKEKIMNELFGPVEKPEINEDIQKVWKDTVEKCIPSPAWEDFVDIDAAFHMFWVKEHKMFDPGDELDYVAYRFGKYIEDYIGDICSKLHIDEKYKADIYVWNGLHHTPYFDFEADGEKYRLEKDYGDSLSLYSMESPSVPDCIKTCDRGEMVNIVFSYIQPDRYVNQLQDNHEISSRR